jgi:hypothetical protein
VQKLHSPDTSLQPDPVYRETETRRERPRLDGEIFDAPESDPKLLESFAAADRKAERTVGPSEVNRGDELWGHHSIFVARLWNIPLSYVYRTVPYLIVARRNIPQSVCVNLSMFNRLRRF